MSNNTNNRSSLEITNSLEIDVDDSSQAPKDNYNVVHMSCVILGVTTLLPWNFFITATDYWMYKFRDVNADGTNNEKSQLQIFFESYLAIASKVSMLTFMLLNTFYGQKLHETKRFYGSLYGMLVIFLLTTIFVVVDTDHMQDTFFAITMIMVVLINAFSAVFQAALYGLVASLPSHCMHAMVNGQAYGGLLAVLIQLSLMIRDIGPVVSGFFYFLISTLFLGLTIICYWSMDNEYTNYYLRNKRQRSPAVTGIGGGQGDLKRAFKECWPFACTVTIVFWATLAVFPGVCVNVQPQHPNSSSFKGQFFVILGTFLLFNVADVAGRLISTYLQFPERRKELLLAIASGRVIIPMLILFCNVQPRHYTPVLFSSDIIYTILMGITSVTNGYLFSSAMVMSSINSSDSLTEVTGFIMTTSLGVGLALGSISSTILLRLV